VNKIESVVIVKGDVGSTAALRFEDPKDDKFFSSNSKRVLYEMVEQYVCRVTGIVVS
jgi:hypothetical protein